MPIDEKIHDEDHAWIKVERENQVIRLQRFKKISNIIIQWTGGLVTGIITTILAYLLDRH